MAKKTKIEDVEAAHEEALAEDKMRDDAALAQAVEPLPMPDINAPRARPQLVKPDARDRSAEQAGKQDVPGSNK